MAGNLIGNSRYPRIRKLDNNTVITRKLIDQANVTTTVVQQFGGGISGGGVAPSSNTGGSGTTGLAYAQVTTVYTDLATTNGNNATPTVTSASYTFTATDVGNFITITLGTNWFPGTYNISSISGGGAVLNESCGNTASLTSGTWFEFASTATNTLEPFITGDTGIIVMNNAAATQLILRYEPINNPLFMLECF
ncbi:MAG TPA: hypothetical protein VKR58_06005 [Aquella sp.]|nr:hypothetical protein [Aquella sp.]